MKVKYFTTLAAVSLLSLGVATGCSNSATDTSSPAPDAGTETQVSPAAETEASPAAETKENPCAGKANPCAGKENPCAGKANPCAGKSN